MKREEVEKFIEEEYAVLPDYLWKDDHITGALRHPNSKKWFGILMRISARRLNINTDESVDIINVKLDPDFIQVLLRDKVDQVFPAYHMNKKHWISILLERTDAELIRALIHESYKITL